MDIDQAIEQDIQPGNQYHTNEFYLKYYSGHEGRFGHEFLEFSIEMKPHGKFGEIRYSNNSNYRREDSIKKVFCVSRHVIDEVKKIVEDSEIMRESDAEWPPRNRDGKQSLKIRMGRETKNLVVSLLELN
jgi:protein mago nashi